jgi:hypothetical protein
MNNWCETTYVSKKRWKKMLTFGMINWLNTAIVFTEKLLEVNAGEEILC